MQVGRLRHCRCRGAAVDMQKLPCVCLGNRRQDEHKQENLVQQFHWGEFIAHLAAQCPEGTFPCPSLYARWPFLF